MSILKYFLLGFGGISLLVGAFVIFNTLSITVAQRTREFATLRTLGGSRKQVMRTVVLEGGVIGLLASVLGLLAGIGLAKGMVALFSAMGFELPAASTVIAPRTIIVSVVVGTVVTLIASILPARRATRVPPIAAVREGATLPPSRFAAHSFKTGLGVVAASVAALLAGMFVGGLSTLGCWSRCSPAACSARSPAWRCSRRIWSGRWPASSACRRAPSAASRASWPAPTPSATPGAPRPRPRR